MLDLVTHVSLFTLSQQKTWDPVCGEEWIFAKLGHTETDLKLIVSPSENFDSDSFLLDSNIQKSTQWILVAEDFAEFEDKNGVRYGMYFESEADASNFTAAISASLIEINSSGPLGGQCKKPPTLPSLAQAREDSIDTSVSDESVTVSKSAHSSEQEGRRRSSVHDTATKGNKAQRRRSLADFKEIDEAVGNAFSTAIERGSEEGIDFNQACDQQIVAVHDRDRSRTPTSDDMSPPPPRHGEFAEMPPPPGTSPVVGDGSSKCLPKMFPAAGNGSDSKLAGESPSAISNPDKNTFRHTMRVVFNEDLSRFEGLPAEWKHQNRQFGVPYETLQKRHVDGYRQSIPTLLVMLKRHLFECGAAEVVGIFRLAPDQDLCKMVKDQINSGEYEGNCNDPNILANLIKVFFRELPVNVLNMVSDESIHKIARLTPQETIDAMEGVFGETNEVVYWLLDLMAEIVMNEDRNKMSVKNMAIVMSPNLYAVTSENAMVALTMAQKVAEFTTNILAARLMSKYNYTPR